MTVRADGLIVHLEGQCPVEEAEALTGLLSSPGPWTVDLTLCRHLHGAVVQVLLRFRPALAGESEISFIRDLLGPALVSSNLQTEQVTE